MIKYFEGTVFNVDALAIVNTVNCTGVMGAGIALEFMLRYPEMFKDYENKCKQKTINTGLVNYYKNPDGKIIINFPTKWHFKYPSKMIWIEQGLKHFIKTYKENGVTSAAFPKLGTNNGGLNWEEVKNLMERYLSQVDIDVYICLDTNQNAEGIEKKMVDSFNLIGIEQIGDIVKLTTRQKENLQQNMPYSRFWKIGETESVGRKTYGTLFNHFYENECKGKSDPIQLSLFE